MVNPFRSESNAFRFAVGCAIVAAVSLVIGLFASPIAAAAVFGTVAAGAVVVGASRREQRLAVLREAAEAPHEPGFPMHRVLVVANEALTGRVLRDELMRRVELWPELHIVAPVLCSRLHYWTNDSDRELSEARRRLDETLAWAVAVGFEASGDVGDASEHPLVSIEAALRRFGAAEVVVATHPPGHESWFEPGLIERLREELDVPVMHLVVDREQARVAITL